MHLVLCGAASLQQLEVAQRISTAAHRENRAAEATEKVGEEVAQ